MYRLDARSRHASKKSGRQLDREINEALASRGSSREHHARRNPGSWRGTEVQSLLFSRPEWTPGKAKTWAKGHDFRYGNVDVTDNYVRLRQFDPVPGTQKRTITFGKGIKAVIEQVK